MQYLPAELLLDLANHIDDRGIRDCSGLNSTGLARAVLALKFAKAPKSVHLRAIVEEWTFSRIVQELY